jgi:hypothetical protein
MKRVIFQIVGALLGAAGLVYIGDYAVLRYRIARNLSPYGSVTVNVYYAVPQKNGKMEYDFQSSQPEVCVNSVFSHAGYAPCWYLRRQSDKQIQL